MVILYNRIMEPAFGRLILKIPYPLLRKVLYIYVGAVIFWDSAPVVSIVLWGLVILTLLVIKFQSELLISSMLARYSPDKTGYVERLRAPLAYSGPRVLLLLVAGMGAGYLLRGQLGLSGVQIFSLIVGYVVFYRETTLLGAYVVYLATGQGIGILFTPGHMLLHTFLLFGEIRCISVIRDREPSSPSSFLTPVGNERSGLLLVTSSPDGFSSQDHDFFIAPKDMRAFLSHLPSTVKVTDA